MPQPDHLRCSDADRTAIEQLLTDAYSDGRLTREEHDERLNRTWEAKTFGDLREITADLVPTDPKPVRRFKKSKPVFFGKVRKKLPAHIFF